MLTRISSPSRSILVILSFLLAFFSFPGTNYAGSAASPVPLKAVGGYYHSLFLLNDGSVWSSGYNDMGQGGLPPEETNFIASPIKLLEDITDISAGGYHNLALKEDKTVWAWGSNESGELGQVTSATYSSVPAQVAGLENITELAAGYDHSLALDQDGHVWAWGSNRYGQLGQDVGTPQNSVPIKVKVKDNSNQDVDFDQVKAISAGNHLSAALRNDGTVWAWGYNYNASVPKQVSGLSNIVQISAGNGFILALDGSGQVWGYGNNLNGQLGINDNTIEWVSPAAKVKDDSGTGYLSDIKAISTYNAINAAMFLSNDGTVYSVGHNGYGRLGDGSTDQRLLPVKAVGLSQIVAIGGGRNHGMAIDSTGKLYSWGNNGQGQLGNGTYISRTTPLKGSGRISSISVTPSTLAMKMGDPVVQLKPKVELNNPFTDGSLEWQSSDESVAKVDPNGQVEAVGPGSATITVASGDDTSINAVTQITVANNNAAIATLNLSGISISPSVSADVYEYTASVPYEVNTTTVDATAANPLASVTAVKLNGNSTANPVSLSLGSNVITVEITAEDGTVQPYHVTVTRKPKSNDTGIAALSLSNITLDQSVSSSVYTYTASVSNAISVTSVTYSTVNIFATAELQVNGIPAGNPINLNVGSNIISIIVTAQDGTKLTYTVNVTRKSKNKSSSSSAGSSGVAVPEPEATTELPVTTETPTAPETPAPASVFTDHINSSQLISSFKDRIIRAKSETAAASLSDISNHWSKDNINLFVKLGVVTGYEDGSFHPDAHITRAEFATIIAKVFNLQPVSDSPFTADADMHWAKESIHALASRGIINGYEDGTFKPDRTITRAEIIAIISRVVDLNAVKKEPGSFSDIDGIWNAAQIQAASDAGLIQGRTANTFAPGDPATKAESLTIILRALDMDPDIKALLEQLK